jgi:hypothetical protein
LIRLCPIARKLYNIRAASVVYRRKRGPRPPAPHRRRQRKKCVSTRRGRRGCRGSNGGLISANVNGARCARITARMAMRGTISPTIRPAPALIAYHWGDGARRQLRFPSVGRALRLTDKFVADIAVPPLATRPRRCSASAAMPEKGQLPAYRALGASAAGRRFRPSRDRDQTAAQFIGLRMS